jgi:ribosomal protein S18 acetylase RimI-like enzyme
MPIADSAGLRLSRVSPAELGAYKALRDEGLRLHPEAFDSDVDLEQARPPESYIGKLGLSEPLGGTFLIGAWVGPQMVGMVGLERRSLPKLRHSANLNSMMVMPSHTRMGIGQHLIAQCLAEARQAIGLELITLKVSSSNPNAIRLYERAGFAPCGVVPHAVKMFSPTGKVIYGDRLTMALLL